MTGGGGKLADYRALAPRGSVHLMLRIAERLRGRRIVQVSASRYGLAAWVTGPGSDAPIQATGGWLR